MFDTKPAPLGTEYTIKMKTIVQIKKNAFTPSYFLLTTVTPHAM